MFERFTIDEDDLECQANTTADYDLEFQGDLVFGADFPKLLAVADFPIEDLTNRPSGSVTEIQNSAISPVGTVPQSTNNNLATPTATIIDKKPEDIIGPWVFMSNGKEVPADAEIEKNGTEGRYNGIGVCTIGNFYAHYFLLDGSDVEISANDDIISKTTRRFHTSFFYLSRKLERKSIYESELVYSATGKPVRINAKSMNYPNFKTICTLADFWKQNFIWTDNGGEVPAKWNKHVYYRQDHERLYLGTRPVTMIPRLEKNAMQSPLSMPIAITLFGASVEIAKRTSVSSEQPQVKRRR